jgi:hypothetical protein
MTSPRSFIAAISCQRRHEGEDRVTDLERLVERRVRLAQREDAGRVSGQIHQDLVPADPGDRSLDGLASAERSECLFLALDLGQQFGHGLGRHGRGGGI